MKERVKDVRLWKDMSLEDLIKVYGDIHGFMAGHLYEAVDVVKEIVRKCDIRFLSFTGNLVATGLRGILAQIIENRLFNVIVTTCGAIDHDIAKSFGGMYSKGFFDADDVQLRREGIHRLGNVFIPMESYGPLIESVVRDVLNEISRSIPNKVWSIREILQELGKRILDENSILRASYRANVPIFVPGFLDGAFGTALFMFKQFNDLKVDVFLDEKELADIVFSAKSIGALIVGGGISKHHTLWWAQFREGLNYVVYISTAIEWDGSLSGARPKEAITWGKLKDRSRHVFVYGDASIILPIIAYSVLFT
uniref:Probable deoxyhypusine synthase n=1 Tax=Ignisphaera aggregans TaxID=334771 RepID=A0A7C4H8W5_9CREN